MKKPAPKTRSVLVLYSLFLLGGCVTPSFDLGFYSYDILAKAIDPRFPKLVATQQCFEPCDNPYRDFMLVHLDAEPPPNDSAEEEDVASYVTPRSFRQSLNTFLIRSFSFEPEFRVLDSFEYLSSGNYTQLINFYFDHPGSQYHQLLLKLPIAKCRAAQTREQKDYYADVRQKIAFVVTIKSRAYVFVSASPTRPDCAGMTIQDVLGDVKGFPEQLYDARYLVYWADLAAGNGRYPHAYAKPVTSRFIPAYPASLMVQADPIPDFDGKALEPRFTCREISSRTDWTTTLHVSATSRGTPSLNRTCTKYKQKQKPSSPTKSPGSQ